MDKSKLVGNPVISSDFPTFACADELFRMVHDVLHDVLALLKLLVDTQVHGDTGHELGKEKLSWLMRWCPISVFNLLENANDKDELKESHQIGLEHHFG